MGNNLWTLDSYKLFFLNNSRCLTLPINNSTLIIFVRLSYAVLGWPAACQTRLPFRDKSHLILFPIGLEPDTFIPYRVCATILFWIGLWPQPDALIPLGRVPPCCFSDRPATTKKASALISSVVFLVFSSHFRKMYLSVLNPCKNILFP